MLAILLACLFPCGTIVAGWLIFLKAPCIIVCDRIKFSAARVREMTSETADYNAIMGYIQEARELTLMLRVLLGPVHVGTVLICSLIAVQWIIEGLIIAFAVSMDREHMPCSNLVLNFSVYFAQADWNVRPYSH